MKKDKKKIRKKKEIDRDNKFLSLTTFLKNKHLNHKLINEPQYININYKVSFRNVQIVISKNISASFKNTNSQAEC